MFTEGKKDKRIGTTHKVFVTATSKSGKENIVHCPQEFSDATNSQVRMAVNVALTTYTKRKDAYEVMVSIDDLPGGTCPDIDVEGESLGLTVAVALISKITGQTIEQETGVVVEAKNFEDDQPKADEGGSLYLELTLEARGETAQLQSFLERIFSLPILIRAETISFDQLSMPENILTFRSRIYVDTDFYIRQ